MHLCLLMKRASLGGTHTRSTSNRSEALSSLDFSPRASGNFSSSGFWEISTVGIVLWQRMLNQLLLKRWFLNMYDSSINFCRLNCKEAYLCCYCDGDREVTHCSQPQVSTGMELGWHCIQVRLWLFRLYQSAKSAIKHTWGKGLRHLIPHFTDRETEVVNGIPHGPGIRVHSHSCLLQPLEQTAKSKVGNALRNLRTSKYSLQLRNLSDDCCVHA